MLPSDVPALHTSVLKWFRANARPMPFRDTRDAYAIWISEIMLQQTTVAAATPYWERFLERFPNVAALAAAPLDDVLHAWSGLGYYSRARNLHAAAQAIVERHGGSFPRSFNDVLALPGVGRYTAGAICSFAFDDDVPVVDANVARVLTRLLMMEGDPKSSATQKALWNAATDLLPHGHARAWNLALFDIGAAVCTPAAPRCTDCPLAAGCAARAQGRQTEYPQIAPKAPMEKQTDVGLVLRDAWGRVLLLQRPPTGVWAGMWEIPRGTVQPGESVEAAAHRIGNERLGAAVALGKPVATIRHTVMRRSITLRVLEARIEKDVANGRWVTMEEAAALALPSPQRRLLAILKA